MTKKFSAILIDDEHLAVDQLESLLKKHADVVSIVDKVSDGEEAVKKVNLLKPDLIFLDIQMPVLTGFQVLEKLSHVPYIIFTTAYDKYAIKAFDTNSIDYLLKPIDPDRLARSLSKLQRFANENQVNLKEQLHELLLDIKKPEAKRIQVRTGNRVRMIDINDIYFFKALDRYVEVNTYDEAFIINDSLGKLEDSLPSEDFKRIHRSAIINIAHMNEMFKDSISTYRIKMKDKKNTVLPLSLKAKGKVFG